MSEMNYWQRLNRKRVSRRTMLGASAKAGVGVAGLALVGCGDDDEEAPAEAPAEAQAVAEIKRGGTYRSTLAGLSSGNPPTLDPHGANITYLAAIPAGTHYSRLLKFMPVAGTYSSNYAVVEPDAVEALPEIPDDQTYVFTLRDNLVFHDVPPTNGRQVTVDDIVQTEAVFREKSGNRANWLTAVKDVEPTEGRSFRFNLNIPFAPMLNLAASHEHLRLVPPEIVADGTVETRPVGSGPWIFEELVPDVEIRWRRNPDWYIEGLPIMDEYVASLVGDPTTIIANLDSQALDASLLNGLPFQSVLQTQLPDLTYTLGGETTFGGTYFDFSKPPWNDVRARQAFSMAMDREGMLAILDETGPGASHTAIPILAPFWLDPRSDEFGPNAKYFAHDVAAARQLLDAAGYPDGIDLRAISSPVYGPGFGQRIELVLSTVADAGFRTEIDQHEYGTYITSTFLGNFPDDSSGLAIAPVKGAALEPDDVLFAIYHPDSARHNYGPGAGDISGDAALLQQFNDQRVELNLDRRIDLIKEIQRVMAEKMYFVPWTGVPQIFGSQPHMRSFTPRQGYASVSEYLPSAWKDV